MSQLGHPLPSRPSVMSAVRLKPDLLSIVGLSVAANRCHMDHSKPRPRAMNDGGNSEAERLSIGQQH